MTVAPLRMMKLKAGSDPQLIWAELMRRLHVYRNDVDPTRSHLNREFCFRGAATPTPLDEAIDRRMAELHTKRAIRKDAVKAVGMMVSTNNALSDEEAMRFLTEAVDWFAERYGPENMLAAAIHMDEGTPHLQLWFAPVISDGEWDRLSAKTLFTPDRHGKDGKIVETGTMSKLQTDFWQEVASKYGYERGLTGEQRQQGYKSLEAYKSDVGRTREAAARVAAAQQRAVAAEDLASTVEGQAYSRADRAEQVEVEAKARERAANARAERAEADADRRVDAANARVERAEAAADAANAKADAAGSRATLAAEKAQVVEGEVKETMEFVYAFLEACASGVEAARRFLDGVTGRFRELADLAREAGEPWKEQKHVDRAKDMVLSMDNLGVYLGGSESLSEGFSAPDRGNVRWDR